MVELSRVKEGISHNIKLDKLDRKILRALFSNERQSDKEIGKKVRASKEVVNYRIKKLKENGILQGTVTIIDDMKLGFNLHIVYYKLQRINKNRETELIDFFTNHPFVKVIATCTGNWDMFVVFCSKNINHYNRLLINFENAIDQNLKRKRIATILKEFFLPYDYIFDRDNKGDKLRKEKEGSKIDIKDLQILKLLSRNSELSLVDIAKKINLTPEAISYRIRNLINEKVIVSFFPLINISSLGYHWYTVSLNLHNITKEKEKELLAYLKAHPNIIVVIKTVGEWNIEFDVHIDSSVKFRELLMQIREQFSDIINDVESNLIFNDYKYTHLPNGLLK